MDVWPGRLTRTCWDTWPIDCVSYWYWPRCHRICLPRLCQTETENPWDWLTREVARLGSMATMFTSGIFATAMFTFHCNIYTCQADNCSVSVFPCQSTFLGFASTFHVYRVCFLLAVLNVQILPYRYGVWLLSNSVARFGFNLNYNNQLYPWNDVTSESGVSLVCRYSSLTTPIEFLLFRIPNLPLTELFCCHFFILV